MRYRAVATAALVVAGAAWVGTELAPRVTVVERTTVVPLPICNTAALLDGFGRFADWSPWGGSDPPANHTLRGPARGAGAEVTWRSVDPRAVSGSQRVTSVSGCAQVDLALILDGHPADAGFQLLSTDGQTQVTWSVRQSGTNVEASLGPTLERGLANLVAYAASAPRVDFTGLTVDQVTMPTGEAATLSTSVAGREEAGEALRTRFASILAAIEPAGLSPAGAPRASFTRAGDRWNLTAWMPVSGVPIAPLGDPEIRIGELPPLQALRTVHVGDPNDASATWERLRSWAFYQSAVLSEAAFVEIYVSDPALTPPEHQRTELLLPLAD